MADFEVTVDVRAGADEAWERVGAFGDLAHAQEDVTCKGEGKGARRTLPTPQGDIVEKCVKAGEHYYEYVIEKSPSPLEGYRARFEVVPGDEGHCTLRWSGTLEPPAGLDAEDFVPAWEQSLLGMLEKMKAAAEG